MLPVSEYGSATAQLSPGVIEKLEPENATVPLIDCAI